MGRVSDTPKVIKSKMYSAKETAALLSISVRTLQRHTTCGYITKSTNKYNGRNAYLGAEILRYWGGQY